MVEFDLGGAEDAQEERKVGQHAQEEPDMIARVMEERTENVSGCCRSLEHPRNSSGSAMWCLKCRSGIIAATVRLAGALNVDISIQGTMINIHFFALIMGM